MRVFYPALIILFACSSPAKPATTVPAPLDDRSASAARMVAPPESTPSPVEAPAEAIAADAPKATVAGNTFIAPAGWTLRVRGTGTILEAPEGGSFIALYDLADAKDAEAAIEKAWTLYKNKQPYALINSSAHADLDGWTQLLGFNYDVPPNLKRAVGADVRFANGAWTAVILDMDRAVAEKRGAQVALILGKLLPKGGARESFAGKRANPLNSARIAALTKFVADAEQATGVPGVALGLIEHGKVVFSGGIGVRKRGKPAQVDGNTKFMVASNTKALATLMLAKLVDDEKITWDAKATSLLPSFKLGDAETTSRVMVKHLICACTGLPRQDLEWLFEWADVTPAKVMALLGTMQPTSEFGALFQYSNPLAAAAGFLGGHVAYPELELGAAFDKAMQTEVFDPLKMSSTTFDFAKGQRGNAAVPHAPDVDGKPALAIAKVNTSVAPIRPAGAAWSSVNDMLKYVQMELAEGVVGGKRYIGKDALLARRVPQVAIGTDATYGMGLMVDTTWGVGVVHHGGDLIGFHSDMMWLPEYGVGAVILTNGDPGWMIRGQFQRKLLEVLFDGKAEADARVAANAKAFFEEIMAGRKLMTVPADPELVNKLAAKYTSTALGEITVKKAGAATRFDFGEYTSEVASRNNPDGSVSFITIDPGIIGFEFVVGARNGKTTLTIRDGQHEYVFTPV
jgi:CubicO group peptidase (beta-lactamase class C family)